MLLNISPSIYVACLASYNAGILYGKLISVEQGEDAIHDEIREMLSNSPVEDAEEWEIHDYDDFGSIDMGEYCSISKITKLVNFLVEHGKLGQLVLENYVDDLEEAGKIISENYQGAFSDEVDFVRSINDDLADIPDYIAWYIDYDAMARDYFISDFHAISDENGNIHVFNQN